eukprot:5319949-Amphidinium_carterae.1
MRRREVKPCAVPKVPKQGWAPAEQSNHSPQLTNASPSFWYCCSTCYRSPLMSSSCGWEATPQRRDTPNKGAEG